MRSELTTPTLSSCAWASGVTASIVARAAAESHLVIWIPALMEAQDSATSEARADLELKALNPVPRLGVERVGVGQAQRPERRNPGHTQACGIPNQAEVDTSGVPVERPGTE